MNMEVVSGLTMKSTPQDEGRTKIKNSPNKNSGRSIQSPSACSRSSQEENTDGRDKNRANENTWKGDPWSQEDVRVLWDSQLYV